MYNSDIPTRAELPTARQLLRSTVIAIGVAAALLVTVVLPAEYGIDPTGAGRILGLTQMGEIKMQREAASADASTEVTAAPSSPVQVGNATDEMTITLAPGEATEVKVEMVKGARMTYAWTVDGGVVTHDTHGEPFSDPDQVYTYSQGRNVAADEGTLEAAFDGVHGWYWRNRGESAVTVTVRASGAYRNFHRKS